MYRVIAMNKGKYGNVIPGARYCFRKKTAAHLIALFTESECDFTIEQFIRIRGDMFCWSGSNISAKIWDMADKMLDKSKQK
jgi:hypothetical protein